MFKYLINILKKYYINLKNVLFRYRGVIYIIRYSIEILFKIYNNVKKIICKIIRILVNELKCKYSYDF